MKLTAAIVSAALMVLSTGVADARERKPDKRKYSGDRGAASWERRSSTVDRRGLCQRDTGRTLDSLNLNHRCDREEFWQRFNDLGGDGRR